MNLPQATLDFAATKIGEKEATGNNDGPFVEMLQHWMDGGSGWMKGQPWCATFACWCIAQAASQLGVTFRLIKSASSSELYNWYKQHGLLLAGPQNNCIGLLRGDGGAPGKNHHHTFMVESVDLAGGVVHSIDGNENNCVCRATHPIANCDFGPII